MKEKLFWVFVIAAIVGLTLSHYMTYLHGWDTGWEQGTLLSFTKNFSCLPKEVKR